MTIKVLKTTWGWGPFSPNNTISGAAAFPFNGEKYTDYTAASKDFGWCALGYTFAYPGVTNAQLGVNNWLPVGNYPGDDAQLFLKQFNSSLDVALLGNNLGDGNLTIHLNGAGGGACFDAVIPFNLNIWGGRYTVAAGSVLYNSMALAADRYYNNGGETFLQTLTIANGAVVDTSASQDVGLAWADLPAAIMGAYGVAMDPAADLWQMKQTDIELGWSWSSIPAHDLNGGGGYPFVPNAKTVSYIVPSDQTFTLFQVGVAPPPAGPNTISFQYPDGTLANQWQYLNWSYPPFNTTIPFLNYSYAAPTKHFKRGK